MLYLEINSEWRQYDLEFYAIYDTDTHVREGQQ